MSTSSPNTTDVPESSSKVYCKAAMANSTLTLWFILVMVLIMVLTMYFIRFKVAIFALLHSRKWMPPATIKGEDKKYDGFLCYDNQDQHMANEIAQKLEQSRSRICIPSRDWASGGEFSRNIDNTMLNSWATLLLLTKNSAANIAFQEEFRNAYIKLQTDKTHTLILIKSQDYEANEEMVEEFLKLLRGKTSIVWGEKLLWEKLLYLVRPKVKVVDINATEVTPKMASNASEVIPQGSVPGVSGEGADPSHNSAN